jgi:Transposase DDE domain
MIASDFTVELFCRIDDAMPDLQKHPLSALHPSEVITIGLLHALRGEGNRAFYRWLEREMKSLFPRLPERTRLFRLLTQYAPATQHFLAQPTLFGVCDSLGIELLHPRREGRSPRQIGKKGKSNRRWIVGAKLGLLCNGQGQVVDWQCSTANVYDATFHPLLEKVEQQMIVLCDRGFYSRRGNPANLKVCPRNTWNERMTIETVFSLFTGVMHLKKLAHRSWAGLQARLAYAVAAFNLCTAWSGQVKISLAEFAL